MKNFPILFILCFVFITSCNNTDSSTNDSGPNQGTMCGMGDPVDTAWYSSGQKAPLFSNLGSLSFPVTTSNEEANKYFQQGLMFSFGFNHAEAARSFFEATRLDSNCAMCWWGFAYVLGPNYNAGMEPDNFERAYRASQKALQLSQTASPLERELITALQYRYAADTSVSREVLDSAYSKALKSVYTNHRNDATVAALYAESLMDQHPWDLWEKSGKQKPWTNEILQVLEKGLAINENHPGLNHFYIHACEASKQAERAMASADRLGSLVPGSGHLVHMPSHIYIRTGRYHDGTVANEKAVLVDSNYMEACHAQGAYPLAYYPHNYHFMAATATLEGNSKKAIDAAYHIQKLVNKKLMGQNEWSTLLHYYTVPWNVEVKFGKWDDILSHDMPDSSYPYAQAVLHYARGMAFLSKTDMQHVKEEMAALDALTYDSTVQQQTIWGINKMSDILFIAGKVLRAEVKAKKEKYDEAIRLLQEAITVEDALNYDEPPDWFFSVRHYLGAVQLEAGYYKDAIATYEQDLKTFPNNGWALTGLYKALIADGNTSRAEEIKKQFDTAWAYSDTPISSSIIR